MEFVACRGLPKSIEAKQVEINLKSTKAIKTT